MSIEAAFIVAHPPLIVSEVGKGSEQKVIKTIESYKKFAQLANFSLCVSSLITSPCKKFSQHQA